MYGSQSLFTNDTFTVLIALYIIATFINQVSMAWHRKKLKDLKDDINRQRKELDKEKRNRSRYL